MSELKTLPQDHLNQLLKYLEERAENLRENAAYGGMHHDGGSGAIKAQIEFYLYGRRGVLPKEWEDDYKEVLRRKDPEWMEYQRLKSKFE